MVKPENNPAVFPSIMAYRGKIKQNKCKENKFNLCDGRNLLSLIAF